MAGLVVGDVQVWFEWLEVEDGGAVEQVGTGEVDLVAADGGGADQVSAEVVGTGGGAGGEDADPLAGVLQQERDWPEPLACEGLLAAAVGLPGAVEQADEVGAVELVQALRPGAYWSSTASRPGSSGLRRVWIGVSAMSR